MKNVMQDGLSLCRLRDARAFGFVNSGWAYDAYPDLETLDAGRTMTVADLDGPGLITQIHTVINGMVTPATAQFGLPESEWRALCARGVVLEIYYDGAETPAVRVPLADFFADGCGGRAQCFASPYVEKAPFAYNCYFPIPFEKRVRVLLRNETAHDFWNYSFVEYRRLPEWAPDTGLFHATWRRWAFQLTPDTDEPFFHAEGRGHLVGRHWSITTNEPSFNAFHFIMEANNEVRIDGDPVPRVDYLGSEDSFLFAWGWPQTHQGMWSGVNLLQNAEPAMLSVYRFHGLNPIPFNQSLDWRVDWRHEFKGNPWLDRLRERNARGGGWVDYATTHYWYQRGNGYAHAPLPPLEERTRKVLREQDLRTRA